MRITAKVDYAVRAMCELATHVGGPVRGERIATAQAIPQSFLENILHELKRAGLVSTQRGVDGGYRLAKPADEITVADIIRAVEGPLADVRGTRPEQPGVRGGGRRLRDGVAGGAGQPAQPCSRRSPWPTSRRASCPAVVPELLEDPEALRPH